MNKPMHPPRPFFSDLFAQLGLPNDDDAIKYFIASHAHLHGDFRLPEAPFWSHPSSLPARGDFAGF